jgi:P-type conjugative transfer protein TrbG
MLTKKIYQFIFLIMSFNSFGEDIVPPLIDIENPKSDLNNNIKLKKYQQSLQLDYDVASDAITQSLKWQNGGEPKPILKKDGIVKFPYGQYEPTVTCKPLNLCDIELQAGEDVQSVLIGDSIRWNDGDQGIPIVYSGTGSNITPHLVLKPVEVNIATNLMVTTSKRTYMIKLKSSNSGYVVRSGFYYPNEEILNYNMQRNIIKANSFYGSSDYSKHKSLLDITKLNYQYEFDGNNYDWKPEQIFDDGISVYIKLPTNISSKSLPGLCIINQLDSSECELVNFRFNDHFYVVDRLFEKARLINGFGSNSEIITINKKHPNFWSWLFRGNR